ncbi:hypothetical protein D3C77_729050 [compost metagenome]
MSTEPIKVPIMFGLPAPKTEKPTKVAATASIRRGAPASICPEPTRDAKSNPPMAAKTPDAM